MVVLINGPSGVGKSTLAAGIVKKFAEKGEGCLLVETSQCLDLFVKNESVSLAKRQAVEELMATGRFTEEKWTAKLVLQNCPQALEPNQHLLICGLRGGQAFRRFHRQLPFDLVIELAADREVLRSRLDQQVRELGTSKTAKQNRAKNSAKKLEASMKAAEKLRVSTLLYNATDTNAAETLAAVWQRMEELNELAQKKNGLFIVN